MSNFSYTPILRWKKGERNAVERLSHNGKYGTLPYFIVREEQYKAAKKTAKKPAKTAEYRFVDEMSASWGAGTCFIDMSEIPAGALTAVLALGYGGGVNLIPGMSFASPPPYQRAAVAGAGAHGCGLGLRIDLQEMATADIWAGGIGLPLNQIDLIIDLGNNVANVQALGAVVVAAFQALHAAQDWRSVTIAGTSMPDDFQGYAAGLHLIHRHEWDLWRNISGAVGYRLNYGDYATVPIIEPPEGIAWGFPINAKYTLDADFLICRGVRTKGPGSMDMAAQLLSHARSVTTYHARNAVANCWADGEIDDIAAGLSGPGGLPQWVTISVNRHIELVRHLLP